MKSNTLSVVGASVLLFAPVLRAEIKTVADHNDSSEASAGFKFKTVPSPSKNDAATKARFMIVDGEMDANGGDVAKLHDGRVPTEDDQPSENCFFNAGTEGGRLLIDLGSMLGIKQVNTYSWHPGTRGPQLYKLYAGDGNAGGFDAQQRRASTRRRPAGS
jgi:hypothetical protein